MKVTFSVTCTGGLFMRKILLLATGFVLCTASAYAADLPSKAPAMVAPAPASWTGWYVGINGGGVWGSTDPAMGQLLPDSFFAVANRQTVLATGSTIGNNSGGLVGGQVGYLYQMGPAVLGLEAGFDWMGVNQSSNNTAVYPNNVPITFNWNLNAKADWLFTLLGRIGIDMGSWYPYVTGGLAVSELKYSAVFTDTFYPGNSSVSLSETKAGYALGAGVEWRWDAHWMVRGEYLYVAFDGLQGTSPVCTNAGACAPGTNQTTFTYDVKFRENIGRVALSYKW